MAYTVNLNNGDVLATVADGTIDTSATNIILIGKNYTGYGEVLNENYVWILENFAGDAAPTTPITGQLWWSTADNVLNVYDGSQFKSVSSSTVSPTEPPGSVVGDLWWNSSNEQLFVYNGTIWVLIGPAFTTGAGQSGAVVAVITDTSALDHVVVMVYAADTVISITSKDAVFTPNDAIPGFVEVRPGINLANISVIPGISLTGTASNATSLDGISAVQLLRSDVDSATVGTLAINNDSGIRIGTSNNVQISVDGVNNTNIFSRVPSASMVIGTTSAAGQERTSLFIDGASGNINASGMLITNISDPIADQDAASKLYVDQAAAGAAAGAASGSELIVNKNTPNGYAGLDGSSIIAISQIPQTSLSITESQISDFGSYQTIGGKNAANGYAGLSGSSTIAISQIPQTSLSITESQISDFGSYQIVNEKNQNNGYAGLDASGLLDPLQLPGLALTSVSVVTSEASQLALTVQEGDVAVRTDIGTTFVAINSVNATISDWAQILSPTAAAAVTSVAGKIGAVTLTLSDLTDSATVITTAGGQTINGTLNSRDITADGATLDSLSGLSGRLSFNGLKKNLIINGSFNVRLNTPDTGLVGITNGTYFLDRSRVLDSTGNGAWTITLPTIVDDYLYISRTAGTGRGGYVQHVEVPYLIKQGTELTLSCRLKHVTGNTAYTFALQHRSGGIWDAGPFGTPFTGSMTVDVIGTALGSTLSATFTIPADLAPGDLVVAIYNRDTSLASFGLTDIQLEFGPSVTPFESRSLFTEEGLCGRYFRLMPVDIGPTTNPSRLSIPGTGETDLAVLGVTTSYINVLGTPLDDSLLPADYPSYESNSQPVPDISNGGPFRIEPILSPKIVGTTTNCLYISVTAGYDALLRLYYAVVTVDTITRSNYVTKNGDAIILLYGTIYGAGSNTIGSPYPVTDTYLGYEPAWHDLSRSMSGWVFNADAEIY